MTTHLSLAALAFLAVGVALSAAPSPARAADAVQKAPGGVMYHVVSIKFKEGTKPEQIRAVEDAFKALKDSVPEIKTLAWGTNVSPEKHDKGFTHCFVLTFATDKDRDAYLVHPQHKAFGKVLGPVMGDVFVLDFVSKE